MNQFNLNANEILECIRLIKCAQEALSNKDNTSSNSSSQSYSDGNSSSPNPSHRRSSNKHENRISFRNFDFRTSTGEIEKVFSAAGHIKYISLYRFSSGRSKGMGVIKYSKSREASNAISMFHRTIIYDKEITVRLYDSKRDKKDGYNELIKYEQQRHDNSNETNVLFITLQSDKGRRSRVRLRVKQDEPFESILNKYCTTRRLPFEEYLVEFSGNKVNLSDTPTDLKLKGDEMIDVKRRSIDNDIIWI